MVWEGWHREVSPYPDQHLFADSGPFDPAKQFLADFLDSRADVFLLCPLMSQKWTVR